MEYIVSARKYRPLTFDAVVGQSTLTTTLKNAITSGKLAHAYLFCGPRGVGKTTCARIFARAINCLNPAADGEACGECESCKAFNEQRSYNVFELDAASNNGVDDIRSLTEQLRIPPQIGRYKVFIIDEVHMLSTAAFNAFLKSLEEPPAHVVFILATTEKNKLLPTIISRCQIYDFERITVQQIIDHLRMVADKEGIAAEEEALAVIAEKADGGMRDALSVFDQVASYCQGNITYALTIEDLNVLDVDNYFRIVDLSLDNNSVDIMLLLDSVISKGFDPGNLCQGLARHIRNVMMAMEEKTTVLLEMSAKDKLRYAEQAKRCSPRFLYSALKILNTCEVNYRQSSNKRLLAELTLIEISQITQDDDSSPAGLRPHRLKTLSNKKAKQEKPSKVAPQVATGISSDATADATKAASHAKDDDKPAVKLSDVGMTFAKINTPAGPSAPLSGDEADDDGASPQASDVFTQEMLETQWLKMCNRMALLPNMKGLALRMKNISPLLTDYPAVEIVAENSLLLNDLEKICSRIEATLRKELNNREIGVSLRLADPSEIKPLPSKAQRMEEIRKSNPSLELLFNNFDLVLL